MYHRIRGDGIGGFTMYYMRLMLAVNIKKILLNYIINIHTIHTFEWEFGLEALLGEWKSFLFVA